MTCAWTGEQGLPSLVHNGEMHVVDSVDCRSRRAAFRSVWALWLHALLLIKMVNLNGRPSLSVCLHSLAHRDVRCYHITHSSRVAACGANWTLRYFEKADLNEKLSDCITVGTLVHDETEEDMSNVEPTGGECCECTRERYADTFE